METRVYVNWPTGKDGPYKVKEDTNSNVWLKDLDVVIPAEWCEYVEEEFEDGRWVFVWSEEEQEPNRAFKYNTFDDRWDFKEPVYRQWEELTKKEREYYRERCERFAKRPVYVSEAKLYYEEAYQLISKEIHP